MLILEIAARGALTRPRSRELDEREHGTWSVAATRSERTRPRDLDRLALLAAALLAEGRDEATIAAIMGGSAVSLLRATLPPR